MVARGTRALPGALPATQFWEKESFDRYIRSESHFASAVEYIHMNPVKAKLCSLPEDWAWSSARQRATR